MKRTITLFVGIMIPFLFVACKKKDDFPQGWTWGQVSHASATLWVRGDRAGWLHLKIDALAPGTSHDASAGDSNAGDSNANNESAGAIYRTAPLSPADDYIARLRLQELRADTIYTYRLWIAATDSASAAPANARVGQLRTAPAPDQIAPVRFVFGGDLGGQNACRDVDRGYPVFDQIAALEPDFFLGLGDMIYADDTCEPGGRFGNRQAPDPIKGTRLAEFRSKWIYNRSDEKFKTLLARVPYEAIWDDHEVINDFNPASTGTAPDYDPAQPLMPAGLRAWRDFHPVNQSGPLYRRVRRGAWLELFILDNRSYRDPQTRSDRTAAPKTMLGREQLRWLKRSLKDSNARWKIIVSSVPIAIPTGKPGARDGWANFDGDTGYENELRDIFEFLDRENIRTVWLTTDVHFAAVFRYAPRESSPKFLVHEFVTGPLNAGLFPNRDFDETFAPERLFFHGPTSADAVTKYEEALQWFNFGLVEVAPDGALTTSIIDARGKLLYELKLD